MITRARRAMSLDEADDVRRLQRDGREAVGCLIAAFVFCSVLAGLVGACGLFGIGAAFVNASQDQLRFGGTGFLVGFIVMAVLWRNVRPAANHGFAADLEGGEVDLVHVHAFSASAALGQELYFFDVGEEKVIVVRGPATRAPLRAGRFPNRYFTLVRLPRADRTLRIDCHGEPIVPRALTREPPLSQAVFTDGVVLPRGALAAEWRP